MAGRGVVWQGRGFQGDWQAPGFKPPAPAQGTACPGLVWRRRGVARRGMSWRGEATQGMARKGDWQPPGFEAPAPAQGVAGPGGARQGVTGPGGSGLGSTRQGFIGRMVCGRVRLPVRPR